MSATEESVLLAPVEADRAGEVLDFLITLARHKIAVVVFPFVVAAAAAGVSLVMTPIYSATARVLPPQQSQGAAAMLLGQLGAVGGALGGAAGMKNPGEMYVGMLRSRTVSDRLIERFKLNDRYQATSMTDARSVLARVSGVALGKDGIITIDVDDPDPKTAADLANGFVQELERLTEGLALSEASQRRLFLERQLKHAKDNLADAEVKMRKIQERTGLIRLEEQGKAVIEAVAMVRAQIAAKEVQISAARTFATEQNPEIVRARQELAGLREQLRRLERDNRVSDASVFVPTDKVPEVGLDYVRGLREVKYHETVFELLAKQFELARLDEAKDATVVQVIDAAVPPDRRSSPKRGLIVIVSFFAAVLVGIAWAVLQEARRRASSAPENADRMRQLRAHLWTRSR